MRLINADELIEGYKHMGYDPAEHPEESYMEGWCKGFNAAVDHCLHHVIHAPTIEQPVQKIELDGAETQIEILSALRTQFNCFDEAEEPVYRALSDAICALSAQSEQHWIPVTERMPEYGTEVVTINKDDEYEINHVIDEEDGEWFFDGAVAWVPLLKPYKEGEEDGN